MRCKITASAIYPKFAKVNFIHPRDDCFPGFVREAIAFPCYFHNDEKITVPYDIFKHVLTPGVTHDIVWSKKLNCFVIRFNDGCFDPLTM